MDFETKMRVILSILLFGSVLLSIILSILIKDRNNTDNKRVKSVEKKLYTFHKKKDDIEDILSGEAFHGH